jgi:hypothetical protein
MVLSVRAHGHHLGPLLLFPPALPSLGPPQGRSPAGPHLLPLAVGLLVGVPPFLHRCGRQPRRPRPRPQQLLHDVGRLVGGRGRAWGAVRSRARCQRAPCARASQGPPHLHRPVAVEDLCGALQVEPLRAGDGGRGAATRPPSRLPTLPAPTHAPPGEQLGSPPAPPPAPWPHLVLHKRRQRRGARQPGKLRVGKRQPRHVRQPAGPGDGRAGWAPRAFYGGSCPACRPAWQVTWCVLLRLNRARTWCTAAAPRAAAGAPQPRAPPARRACRQTPPAPRPPRRRRVRGQAARAPAARSPAAAHAAAAAAAGCVRPRGARRRRGCRTGHPRRRH